MSLLRRAVAASAAVLMAAGGVLTAPAASAAPLNAYVALGDSYSSGDGAGSYLADGTSCLRSLGTYGGIIAAQFNLQLNLQACAGAVTADVLSRQLGSLSSSTRFVTISVGGNDVGFADVITECAKPGWMSNCNRAIDNALAVANNQLPGRLDSVYAAIKARAPQARVVVAGYPRLFNGTDCHALTFFSGDEMSRLNAAADRLSVITSAAASRAGFRYADVRGTFTGRAVCDRPEWIHNLSLSNVRESFHPKADGYRYGYTPPVVSSLGLTSPLSGMSSVTTGGVTSSDTRRGQVRVPDLTTREARAAAAKAGISAAELDALVRAQRAGASNAKLEAMSAAAVG